MTKAERTRQSIIIKSAPLFNKKGVAGTALSDILKVTKLAKGSLYVHFKDKEELSHVVVDYHLTKLADVVEKAVSAQSSFRGKLFAYLDTFFDPLHPPLEGGCPMLNFGMEADDTDQVIRQKVKALIDVAKLQIADLVRGGVRSGEFKDEVSPGEFAVKMFAMIEGGIMMSRIAGDNSTMKMIIRMLKKEIEQMKKK